MASPCYTVSVRNKLWLDYGIRDIPHELLEYLIRKEKAKYERLGLGSVVNPHCDAATCAFLVASIWQKGKTAPACN